MDASGHRGEVIEAVLKGNSLSYLGNSGPDPARRASVCIRMGPTGIHMDPYGSDRHLYASVSVDGHPYASVWVRQASVCIRMGPTGIRMGPTGIHMHP